MVEVTRVLVGLDEYEVVDAVEDDDELVVTVQVGRAEAACPRCGVFSARVKQRRCQRVRDGFSFDQPTTLLWLKRRVRCGTPGCGSFTESTQEVPPRAPLTGRLQPAIAKAAKDRSTAAVAGDHRVSWWTAWAGHHGCRRAAAGGPVGDAPRRLGADETSFRRPGRFMSGLVDLDTGRLWDLFEGRSKAVLAERLRLLGDNVVEIESVVIDPYAGYKAAVRELAPHAVRVADRFHIERLVAQALTDVRCRLQQALTGHRGRKADPLYRIRRRLLASHDRLDHTSFASVLGWLDVGDPEGKVGAAYLAKELLRDTYLACSALEARRRLVAFDDCPAASDVPEFERLARTIARWETPILRWHHTGSPTRRPRAPT